jgi:SagB-type dehydrogenase family enzyme
MRSRELDYIVIAPLLVSSLYVALTGLVMDLFGFHQFFYHNFAGYITIALVGLHLTLNWGRITTFLRWRFKRRLSPIRPGRGMVLDRRGFLALALTAIGGFILGRFFPARRSVAGPDPGADVGQFYHQWSKPGYSWPTDILFSWGEAPPRDKTYPEAKRIVLPAPGEERGLSLAEAIEQRRSRREYTNEPLPLADLSRLLHAAGGITDPTRGFRSAPSAGALYPIEIYVVVHNVPELAPGLYHYATAEHALEQLQSRDLRAALLVAGIGQEMLGQAQVCFILSAVFQRTRWKYRERTYRYILLEAGHIGQNLYLAATSLGLGACAIGAFLDDDCNDLLGLDGEEEAALYLIPVGKV